MIKINHEAITSKLEEILRSIGGKPAPFNLPPPPTPPDVTLGKNDLPALVELFHEESGLLIRNGRPIFVYIPDHEMASKFGKHNRVHFAVCTTLREKREEGKLGARFRVTERDDNLYRIDVGNQSREERLLPCQNCLLESGYPGFPASKEKENRARREEIAESFEAKTAFALLRERFVLFRVVADSLQSAEIPTGYPRNWEKISMGFREMRNFTCEAPPKGCGVCLVDYSKLIHAHHIDGDKPNINNDNLLCVCKLCHKEKYHSHLPVKDSERRIIEEARRKQGISC